MSNSSPSSALERRAVEEFFDGDLHSSDSRAETPQNASLPAISVIIPVRNDPENLASCLAALEATEFLDYEVIVVDDASTDSTADVARRRGVRLIQQPKRLGPATARNRGAEAARQAHLFFLDADVSVEPDTLVRVAEKFSSDPMIEAFFGSYDASPSAPGLVSQFRNLLHHYVHQSGEENAFSFWSGCGAIKKAVFEKLGGFDTSFSSASIEDIELGSRLRRTGHEVALVKSIQVKHMKRWTLWNMIRTDITKRGIPWTLLILRQGNIPNDLNLALGQRLSALLAAGVPVTAALAVWAPHQIHILTATALTCLLGIVMINRGFYRFLAKAKHPLFALLALPLHVLYYLCGGIAFVFGFVLHLGRRGVRPQPDSG